MQKLRTDTAGRLCTDATGLSSSHDTAERSRLFIPKRSYANAQHLLPQYERAELCPNTLCQEGTAATEAAAHADTRVHRLAWP